MPRKKKQSEGFAGTTYIDLVWDESGSMSHLVEPGLQHIATQLNAARESDRAKFTLWFFGGHIEGGACQVWSAVNPAEVEAHTSGYRPTGMTPLYDAVGRAINYRNRRLSKSDRALMVIFTDGAENASREFTQEQVKQLVDKMEKQGNWTFLFLAAGFDEQSAQQYAQSIGVAVASSTPNSAAGLHVNSLATAGATSNLLRSSERGYAGVQGQALYAGVEGQHATDEEVKAAAKAAAKS